MSIQKSSLFCPAKAGRWAGCDFLVQQYLQNITKKENNSDTIAEPNRCCTAILANYKKKEESNSDTTKERKFEVDEEESPVIPLKKRDSIEPKNGKKTKQ